MTRRPTLPTKSSPLIILIALALFIQLIATQSPTASPSAAASSASPTATHSTASPTVSGSTISPTATASTVSPTATHSTVSPTVSASTVSPTATHSTVSPTVSGSTVSPTPSNVTVSASRTPSRSPPLATASPFSTPSLIFFVNLLCTVNSSDCCSVFAGDWASLVPGNNQSLVNVITCYPTGILTNVLFIQGGSSNATARQIALEYFDLGGCDNSLAKTCYPEYGSLNTGNWDLVLSITLEGNIGFPNVTASNSPSLSPSLNASTASSVVSPTLSPSLGSVSITTAVSVSNAGSSTHSGTLSSSSSPISSGSGLSKRNVHGAKLVESSASSLSFAPLFFLALFFSSFALLLF